jgi:uncharacterized protein YndB with AHSA1/START domain
MKWLLYILGTIGGVLVLAIVALLMVGGGRGESTLQTSIDIARPAPVVFSWITEPVRVKSWVGWLMDVQSQTPETAGVGAKYVWVMEDRNNGNQRMNIHTVTTRFEQDRVLESTLHVPEGFRGVVTYELQPLDDNHTRLTYRGTYQYQHWLARLLSPVITRSAQQKLQEDVARLKQQAEAS